MNLHKATLLAIFALSYFFTLRTVGTFLPAIFENLMVIQAVQIASLLASLAMVVFYSLFYREYVQKEQIKLKKATVLVIIGSSAMFLYNVKGLIVVFNKLKIAMFSISPYVVRLVESPRFETLGMLVSWMSSLFILVFFIILYQEQKRLKNAALLAVIGFSIGTLSRTITLFCYLYSEQIRWFSDWHRILLFISFPITVVGFIAILYFFTSFYKVQKLSTQTYK